MEEEIKIIDRLYSEILFNLRAINMKGVININYNQNEDIFWTNPDGNFWQNILVRLKFIKEMKQCRIYGKQLKKLNERRIQLTKIINNKVGFAKEIKN